MPVVRVVEAARWAPGFSGWVVEFSACEILRILATNLATNNQHLAIKKSCRRMIRATGDEVPGCSPGSSGWIIYLGTIQFALVFTTRNQNFTIFQERCRVLLATGYKVRCFAPGFSDRVVNLRAF